MKITSMLLISLVGIFAGQVGNGQDEFAQDGFGHDVHSLQSQLEKAHGVIEEQMRLIQVLEKAEDEKGRNGVNETSDSRESGMRSNELAESMKLFQPFIGTWEINARWENGQELWSKNSFAVGIGGNFVDTVTWAKDGDGEVYERYRTVFSYDQDGKTFRSYGFTYDGTVSVAENQVTQVDDQTQIVSKWVSGGNEIKQQVQSIDEKTYSWKVWSRPLGSSEEEWHQLMDGTWRRVDN